MSTQNDPSQNNDDSALILAMDIWGDPDMRTAAACALEALKEAGWLVVRPAQRLRDAEAELAAALELIGKQPDVVAVKLPEPTHSGNVSTSWGWVTQWHPTHQVNGETRLITVDDPGRCLNVTQARDLAAALLAAAARAEAADGAQ